jgi:hypothetical protein
VAAPVAVVEAAVPDAACELAPAEPEEALPAACEAWVDAGCAGWVVWAPAKLAAS